MERLAEKLSKHDGLASYHNRCLQDGSTSHPNRYVWSYAKSTYNATVTIPKGLKIQENPKVVSFTNMWT